MILRAVTAHRDPSPLARTAAVGVARGLARIAQRLAPRDEAMRVGVDMSPRGGREGDAPRPPRPKAVAPLHLHRGVWRARMRQVGHGEPSTQAARAAGGDLGLQARRVARDAHQPVGAALGAAARRPEPSTQGGLAAVSIWPVDHGHRPAWADVIAEGEQPRPHSRRMRAAAAPHGRLGVVAVAGHRRGDDADRRLRGPQRARWVAG